MSSVDYFDWGSKEELVGQKSCCVRHIRERRKCKIDQGNVAKWLRGKKEKPRCPSDPVQSRKKQEIRQSFGRKVHERSIVYRVDGQAYVIYDLAWSLKAVSLRSKQRAARQIEASALPGVDLLSVYADQGLDSL